MRFNILRDEWERKRVSYSLMAGYQSNLRYAWFLIKEADNSLFSFTITKLLSGKFDVHTFAGKPCATS